MVHIGIAGDSVYWDTYGADGLEPAGVYRLPISGGTAELVAGSAGYSLFGFGLSPWLTTAPQHTPTDGSPPRRDGELWNLVTGARLAWTAQPSDGFVLCDPVLCTGQTNGGKAFLHRLDGTGYREPPYDGVVGFDARPAVDGRFGVGRVALARGSAPFVWDRFTGKAAVVTTKFDLPTVPGGGLLVAPTVRPSPAASHLRAVVVGEIGSGFERTMVQWSDGGDGMYVLDLRAIR